MSSPPNSIVTDTNDQETLCVTKSPDSNQFDQGATSDNAIDQTTADVQQQATVGKTQAADATATRSSAADWQPALDASTGAWYYYNLVTGESRWADSTFHEAESGHAPNQPETEDVAAENAGVSTEDAAPGAAANNVQEEQALIKPETGGNQAEGAIATSSRIETSASKAETDNQTSASVSNTPALAVQHPFQPYTAWPYHQIFWQVEGWYYQDAYSVMQGPFTKAQLRGWRGKLPMDLQLWYYDHAGQVAKSSLELAKVIGDGKLLASWREQQSKEGSSSAVTFAPDAASFEAQQNKGKDSFSEYAEAVLAGLPPEDEAVQLARLAAEAGTSVQNVMSFAYAADGAAAGPGVAVQHKHDGRYAEYTVTSVLGKRGRPADGSLYGDMQSWCDTKQLEEHLEAGKERRKHLPPAVVQKLRERKKEMKSKQKKTQLSWLYS